MYGIHASINVETTDHRGTVWTSAHHLPTFYLNENVQGILSADSAERVARSILDPFGERGLNLLIAAVKV